jgi:hypothetical protein
MMLPFQKNRNHLFPLLLLSAAFCGFCADDAPLQLVIYPKAGVPGPGNLPYAGPGNQSYPYLSSIIIMTGDTFPLVAKVFDRAGIWLSSFESDTAPITWKLVFLDSSFPVGTLTSTSGFKSSFIATKTFFPCYIIASFEGYPSDTVSVDIMPRPRPNHLVIESSPNSLTKSPNSDDRLGIMTIGCKEAFKSAYAVTRDVYGNYVSHSEKTVWQSRDTSISEVIKGDSLLGEGIIKCKKYGNTWIFAQDSSLGTAIFDSALALCAGPCPRQYRLQIVKDDSVPLESLTLSLGSSVTLRAQAVWVDSAVCINVSAYWTFSSTLHQPPAAPDSLLSSWIFSPLDTGSGWIKIHVHSENAMPDSIWVTVVPATHANDRRGDPVLKITLGNRIFGVPRDAKTFSIIGFDLRGRVLFRQEKQISGNQLLQSTTGDARHSGIALIVLSFYNVKGNVLSAEKFKSLSFR